MPRSAACRTFPSSVSSEAVGRGWAPIWSTESVQKTVRSASVTLLSPEIHLERGNRGFTFETVTEALLHGGILPVFFGGADEQRCLELPPPTTRGSSLPANRTRPDR